MQHVHVAGEAAEAEVGVFRLKDLDEAVLAVSACVVHGHSRRLVHCEELVVAAEHLDGRGGHARLDAQHDVHEPITVLEAVLERRRPTVERQSASGTRRRKVLGRPLCRGVELLVEHLGDAAANPATFGVRRELVRVGRNDAPAVTEEVWAGGDGGGGAHLLCHRFQSYRPRTVRRFKGVECSVTDS